MPRHVDRFECKVTQGLNVKLIDWDVVLEAHFYILNNLSVIEPYIATHKIIITKKYPQMNDKRLLTRHNKEFIGWFNNRISNDDGASENIKWLSYIPKFIVNTWTTYNISNYFFYTKAKDDHSIMQNSWVMVEAVSMCFSSLKDKNLILATTTFYVIIEEILEIDDVIFKVHLFKCKWVSNINGVKTDELGFTRIDLGKENYNIKPFIMATQANSFLCDTPYKLIEEMVNYSHRKKHSS